jgi:acyl-coenzyme A thioesterase PaaI-like protein
MCDNAGAYTAFTLIDAEQTVLTVEDKVNLVAPASGHKLKAAGEVVRFGRTLTVCQVLATAVTSSGAEQLCALSTVTMMTLTWQGDGT